MPHCRVCTKELTDPALPCPRCGFSEPAFLGDPAKAEQLIEHKSNHYRTQFLRDFNFGVVAYRWKDNNGTLVLDQTERLSFGIGCDLLEKRCWLKQPFARIPNIEKLDIELSVVFKESVYRTLTVTVSTPQGNHLQQIGIYLNPDMTIQLMMKNPESQTQSVPMIFLLD